MTATTLVIILAVLLGVVLLAVLAFLIVRAVFRHSRRVAETGELKKDLMAWRNIRALAQGGDAARRAKADLSSRIGQLRVLFSLGVRRLREQHGERELPWILVLGEPDSGKSTLLANAGLEFQATVRHDADEKQPLVPWISPSAYVLDVGGRVFFDRWLEGSGAEWDGVLSLVRRKRPGKPLEGVVLCVPADALLADDAALTREKTSLVSAELRRLTARLGVNVPCHLVITKCDMMLGWREYFEHLSERERARALGWRNDHPEKPFDEAAFGAWWQTFVEALKDNLDARLLPEFPVDQASGRMATRGRAFLLPQSFGSLRQNLVAYLGRVFGPEAWHGCDQLLLSGVYFTSAADSGTVLCSEFASLLGKRPEEAPMQEAPRETFGGYFIRGLLHDMVAGRRLASSFTPRAQFRRQFGWYLIVLAFVAQGISNLVASIGSTGWLAARLGKITAYYQAVVQRFTRDDYMHSPILVADENGNVRLQDGEMMPGTENLSRIRYLYISSLAASEPLYAGYGWHLASLVRFGFNPNLGIRMRRQIFNRIQADMVFEPIIRCFEAHERKAAPSVFSAARREAFVEYNDLSSELASGDRAPISIERFFLYLVPDCNPEITHLLTTYYLGDGSCSDFRARIAYDLAYIQTERQLYRDFFASWADLSAYPETTYPVLRGILTNACDAARANTAVLGTPARMGHNAATNDAVLAELRTVVEKQRRRLSALTSDRNSFAPISAYWEMKQAEDAVSGKGTGERKKPFGEKEPTAQFDDPLTAAIDDYQRRLEADRKALVEDVVRTTAQLSDQMSHAYFQMLNPDLLNNRFDEIGERLGIEAKGLGAVAKEVRASGLPRRLKATGGVCPEMMSDVFVGLIHARMYDAMVRCYSDDHLTDPLQLGRFLSDERNRAEDAQAALTASCGGWSADPAIAPLLATLRKLMTAQSEANRVRILREYVAVHPKTAAEIGALVARLSEREPADDAVSRRTAESELGSLGFRREYAFHGARELFRAFAEVNALMAPPAADGKGEKAGGGAAAVASSEVPGYAEVRGAMTEYLRDYIDYCSQSIDALAVDFGEDWPAYRARCARIKPYTVNTLLQFCYARAREKLQTIPDVCLTPELKKARDAGLAQIEVRQVQLSDTFTKTCIRQTGSWSLLPADPVEASVLFREMPAQRLLTDYLAVFATDGNKSTVPWWTTFFMRGLQLTQGAAFKNGQEAIRRDGCRYMRFPLCKDPVDPDDVLTESELERVRDALLACGCVPAEPAKDEKKAGAGEPAKDAPAKVDESGNPVLAMARNARLLVQTKGGAPLPQVDPARGAQVVGLVDALTRDRFETVWTLSVLPIAKCAELQVRYAQALPLATVLFRYAHVTYAGRTRSEGVALDGKSEIVLARGDLGDSDVVIRLREFSDVSEDAAVLDFPGAWAALRIYLSKGAVYDPTLKAFCIPLIVTDGRGLRSVLWTTMRFNRALPAPSDWPSTDQWLDSVVTPAK